MEEQVISAERKSRLIAEIKEQTAFWESVYLKHGGYSASTEIRFKTPVCLLLRDHPYEVTHATLEAVSFFQNYYVLVKVDGRRERDLLTEVLRSSKVTPEIDTEVSMAISFLSMQLSRGMLNEIENGPFDNEFANIICFIFRDK